MTAKQGSSSSSLIMSPHPPSPRLFFALLATIMMGTPVLTGTGVPRCCLAAAGPQAGTTVESAGCLRQVPQVSQLVDEAAAGEVFHRDSHQSSEGQCFSKSAKPEELESSSSSEEIDTWSATVAGSISSALGAGGSPSLRPHRSSSSFSRSIRLPTQASHSWSSQ